MFVLLRQLQRIRAQAGLHRTDTPGWLAIRHVDAGSCNACEHELGLLTSPWHDLQRFGLDLVASPRHAELLLITGPVTTRMVGPLLSAYEAMPEPRLVGALGDCALGCNLLGEAASMVGSVAALLPVDVQIPGCPPSPEAIATALLRALAERAR